MASLAHAMARGRMHDPTALVPIHDQVVMPFDRDDSDSNPPSDVIPIAFLAGFLRWLLASSEDHSCESDEPYGD